ncbi:hypothetical protein [Algiphilus sp.]|uniref:hypothetical protein n=1 Tax=Algiphilus sp. TaxID=1872431 RepID=UPI0032EC1910
MKYLITKRVASTLTVVLFGTVLTACGGGGGDGAVLPAEADARELACTETAAPGTTAAPIRDGLLCTLLSGLVCEVGDASLAVDNNRDTFTQVTYRLGLLDEVLGGAAGIRATLPGPIPAGRLAAVDIALGTGVLDLALGRTVTLSTFRNGVKQEERGTGTLLALDLLGRSVIGDASRGLVGFVNTLPYDELQVTVSANLLSLDLSQGARIYDVCVSGRPKDDAFRTDFR